MNSIILSSWLLQLSFRIPDIDPGGELPPHLDLEREAVGPMAAILLNRDSYIFIRYIPIDLLHVTFPYFLFLMCGRAELPLSFLLILHSPISDYCRITISV